ncbi:MAG TPA: hypothetical protein VF680_17260 [Allosphingosinicella sp.]|jgi:hypothetical protein
MVTEKEFEEYLESIGGLENGMFTNKPPIKSAGFFSIGKGWYQLVKDLIEELIQAGWDKHITQVKEKFGGLRFYTNGLTQEQRLIVDKYEELSYHTCEECGEPGKVRNDGWVTVLCDKHYKPKE